MNSIRITSEAAEIAVDELTEAQELISGCGEGVPTEIDVGDVSDIIGSVLGEVISDVSILNSGISGFMGRLKSTVDDFSSADQAISDATHSLSWRGLR